LNRKLIFLVIGALALLAGLMIASGASPLGSLITLLKGSLGTPAAISGTLKETTPLLLLGLAVFISLRAGLFNIGAEGQFLLGAVACTWVNLRIPGVGGIVLGTLAGAVAGALWALPAGLIKAYRNGHEVITTIMLNSVAVYFTTALVAGPMKDPKQDSPTTADLAAGSRLPWLFSHPPVQLSSALLIGVILTLLLAYWLKRTVAGYELQAVGANPGASKYAGIDNRKVLLGAMCASGAIAGIAGVVQVLAYEGRFYAGISPGYGFDALGVALLAGSSAWGVIPASVLFGMLAKGGTALQIDEVPKGITTVVLGLTILVAAALRYRKVTTDV
jgi:simple sugar transport system permease protein